MIKLSILIIGLVAAALTAPQIAKHENKDSRVVGGLLAAEGQFPYIVSIRVANYNYHSCGGSIISKNWVVTAGHCVYGYSNRLIVIAGTNHLNIGGVSFDVIYTILHKEYHPNPLLNDISLLKVSPSITFSETIQPIQLNPQNIAAGTILTLSGWGQTDVHSKLSYNLLYLEYTATSKDMCAAKLYPLPITDNQLCAFQQLGRGSCMGDSGGPLVYKNTLVGIVSWGRPCAIGLPDVYTRVSQFIHWIQTHAV